MAAPRRRAKAALILTGVDEVDSILKTMKVAGANRAARTGITKACREGVKSIRPHVPSTMKDAKKSLGFKVRMEKGGTDKGQTKAKYGLGVGKKQEELKPRGKRKGVGIGARNIHWFAKGTKERFIKSGPRAGQSTGQMMRDGSEPLAKAVEKAWNQSGNKVLETLKQGTLEAIDREIIKARQSGNTVWL